MRDRLPESRRHVTLSRGQLKCRRHLPQNRNGQLLESRRIRLRQPWRQNAPSLFVGGEPPTPLNFHDRRIGNSSPGGKLLFDSRERLSYEVFDNLSVTLIVFLPLPDENQRNQ